jgi:shikimate kinase
MNDVADNGTHRNAEEAAMVRALGTRVLVLIGMMGAGKSSIGRRIAARLNLPFVDADVEIEAAHAGLTIPEIFARYGEPYFRDGEVRVIARLLEGGPSVLATGGGAFMREETQQRIRAKAVSMWLRADPDVIMRRVKRRSDRPLLQTDDPAATIQRLVDERYPIYAKADITVLSRDVPHERIVEECLQMLGAHLRDDGQGDGMRNA